MARESDMFGRRLANKVISLTRKGEDISPDAQYAATRILGGGGSAADVELLRKYFGVKARFKRTPVMKFFGGLWGGAKNISHAVEQYQDVQARGGNTTMAVMRGLKVIEQSAMTFLKTKFVSEVTEGLFSRLGKQGIGSGAVTGTRFLNTLRGGVRAGGRLLGMATIAGQVADKAVEWEKRKAENVRLRAQYYDVARQTGMPPELVERMMNEIQEEHAGRRGFWERMQYARGLATEAYKEEQETFAQKAQILRVMAENPEEFFGARTGKILTAAARRRGLTSPSQLTEAQRTMALMAAGYEEPDQTFDQKQKFMARYVLERRGERDSAQRTINDIIQTTLHGFGARSVEQANAELADEAAKKWELNWNRSVIKHMESREARTAATWENATPAAREYQMQIRGIVAANWNAGRSRRRAWAND